MTLVELSVVPSILTGAVGGTIAGARAGFFWGVGGAIAGAVLGFVAALLVVATTGLLAAALGGTVEIATLRGKASLKVPEGTASGTVFRLRGEGMPNLRNPDRRGDLHVRVEVHVPTKLTAEQRAAAEKACT